MPSIVSSVVLRIVTIDDIILSAVISFAFAYGVTVLLLVLKPMPMYALSLKSSTKFGVLSYSIRLLQSNIDDLSTLNALMLSVVSG